MGETLKTIWLQSSFFEVIIVLLKIHISKCCATYISLSSFSHTITFNLTTVLFYIVFHCVKSAQIQIFFWSIFFPIRTECEEIWTMLPYSVPIRENTD